MRNKLIACIALSLAACSQTEVPSATKADASQSRNDLAARAAQTLDPDCAMCYWGEALALGPKHKRHE